MANSVKTRKPRKSPGKVVKKSRTKPSEVALMNVAKQFHFYYINWLDNKDLYANEMEDIKKFFKDTFEDDTYFKQWKSRDGNLIRFANEKLDPINYKLLLKNAKKYKLWKNTSTGYFEGHELVYNNKTKDFSM